MNRRELKRALHICGGTLVAGGACVVVGLGGVDGARLSPPSFASISVLAGMIALVGVLVARRVRFTEPPVRHQQVSFWISIAGPLTDVETALALVAGSYTLLSVSGGLDSPLYPLLYGVVAFSATFQSRPGAWTTVIAALALESMLTVRAGMTATNLTIFALHAALIAGAAAAHALFLGALVRRYRHDHDRRVDEEIRKQRDSARDYRLIATPLGADSRAPRSRAEQERMLSRGSVQTVSEFIYQSMSMLKRSLGARSCVLLWTDDSGRKLKLKEVVSDADHVTENNVVPAGGVLGAISRDHQPLAVAKTRAGQVPYSTSSEPIGAFLGVPVMEGSHFRGILCADRDEPFEDRDTALMQGATEQIVHAIRSEQVFRAVERSKYEHERFYQASALLCEALTMEQVMDTAFDAAAAIVEYDAAAITIYDPERKRHRVFSVRVRPNAKPMLDVKKLGGMEFKDNSGLVSMVVKNKHYLPAGGELRDITASIYTKDIKMVGAESLLILPLLSADEAIGTFMLASHEPGRFGKDVREMLRIIINQVAVSMQNAMMYRKMETMATTDGLTGLTNHRTFQDRFADLLERSKRHGHEAAILLCDVDHFKKVNDTYGHPVGDEVLRRVARVLMDAVRKIDITARYGGEEFVVVLEATNMEGAIQLAERIRNDVGSLLLDSDKGAFNVTMSIGVAISPADGKDRAQLIEHADHALYHAKESGRNRVVSYQQFIAWRKARKAS